MRLTISLSTAIREYASLKGLPYYDERLLQDILNARGAPVPSLSDSEVQATMQNFQVNEPQAKAILGSLSVKGFALIQGYVYQVYS
jgi:senataxin